MQHPVGTIEARANDAPEDEPTRVIVVNKLPAGEVARAFLVIFGLGVCAYLLWSIGR